MFEKIILCATSDQLTAGVWRYGKLHDYHVYQNDDQGCQEFTQFLQQHRNTKIYLLVDAVEEDYRVESLPHTVGGARRELLERKLDQVYRGVVYRAAHFMSRDKDKRKDDKFLFISLNNADFLQGWMACIEAQEAPLVGVYLLSMVSEALVKRLKLTSPNILLTEHLSSGLRQTYLQDAHLRISRLAPIPSAMLDKLGYFYLVETEKTRLYLMSQPRFVSKEIALKMVLLSLDDSDQQICRSIEQEHGMVCESVSLMQFASSLKLTPMQLKQNPELLHMHLLALGNVPINLAPANFDKHYKLNVIREWVNIATAAILVAGIAVSGWQIKQSNDQAKVLSQAVVDTRSQEQRYNEVAKDFPVTPISGADLQQAVMLNQSIRSYAKTPKRMMQIVSAALEIAPEIQINRLRWVQANDTNLKDEDKTWAAPVGDASATKPQSAFTPDPTALYEIGFINGELKGFKGDYRAALNMVNRFAERLKTDPAIEQVEILQAPVNVSSYSDLQGTTTDEMAAQSAAALFKLRIILKREALPK